MLGVRPGQEVRTLAAERHAVDEERAGSKRFETRRGCGTESGDGNGTRRLIRKKDVSSPATVANARSNGYHYHAGCGR